MRLSPFLLRSHGVFVSLCGFECHGPKQHLGFAPKLTPEDFRAPFIAAEGWGTLAQRREQQAQVATISPRWGQVRVRTIGLMAIEGVATNRVEVNLGDENLEASVAGDGRRVIVKLSKEATIATSEVLRITLG